VLQKNKKGDVVSLALLRTAIAQMQVQNALCYLADVPSDQINLLDETGRTLLHLVAADTWLFELLTPLLSKKPDLDLVDLDGQAPLAYAVFGRNLAAVKALLGEGCSMDAWVEWADSEPVSLCEYIILQFIKYPEEAAWGQLLGIFLSYSMKTVQALHPLFEQKVNVASRSVLEDILSRFKTPITAPWTKIVPVLETALHHHTLIADWESVQSILLDCTTITTDELQQILPKSSKVLDADTAMKLALYKQKSLKIACERGLSDLIPLFILDGANPCAKYQGHTLLYGVHRLICAGHNVGHGGSLLQVISTLLQAGVSPLVDRVDYRGFTEISLLEWAVLQAQSVTAEGLEAEILRVFLAAPREECIFFFDRKFLQVTAKFSPENLEFILSLFPEKSKTGSLQKLLYKHLHRPIKSLKTASQPAYAGHAPRYSPQISRAPSTSVIGNGSTTPPRIITTRWDLARSLSKETSKETQRLSDGASEEDISGYNRIRVDSK